MLKRMMVLITMCCSFLITSEVQAKEYYGKHLCAYSDFKCMKVKRGDTWAKLFPDTRQRELVKRLNRMNIELYGRRWIVVPTRLDEVTNLDLSPFPSDINQTSGKVLMVNLGLQAFAAYQSGKQIHWGPVSGGKDWCDDVQGPCQTATGDYRIIRKQGPECISSVFPVETDGGAEMPYCMHYYRGFALHAATLPGYHASHGCIRLFHDDAKWLNEQFTDYGTRVIVSE